MTDAAEFIPELYDSKANLRPLDSFAAEDLARMSEPRRVLFYAAHKAATEAREVEDAARAGEIEVREAVAHLGELRKVVETCSPPWTAYDEWKLRVKKIERPEPTPEAKEAADLANAEYTAADSALMALCERVNMCNAAVSPSRKLAAAAWAAYHSAYPPKSAAQIHRELMERDKARKLAGTDKPQTVQRQILCALDYSMSIKGGSRRGHRHPDGPAGGRTYGPEMLNQVVAKPTEAPWQAKPMGSK